MSKTEKFAGLVVMVVSGAVAGVVLVSVFRQVDSSFRLDVPSAFIGWLIGVVINITALVVSRSDP